jgi:hypothetical protein
MRACNPHVKADFVWALVFSASAILTIETEPTLRWAIFGACLVLYLVALARRQKTHERVRPIHRHPGSPP